MHPGALMSERWNSQIHLPWKAPCRRPQPPDPPSNWPPSRAASQEWVCHEEMAEL